MRIYSHSIVVFLGKGTPLLLLALMLAVFSTGCTLGGRSGSSQPNQPSTGGKAPRGSKPYTVRGKTYYPVQSAHGFREEGIASWYGRDFHGKSTANGERYNMYGMTAAHKLLPFGTELKVTNLENGKSIIVRVNDRGPFVGNRIIDLTKTGAEKIAMIGKGTARVRLEAIGTVPGLRDDGNMSGKFYVQVGAFKLRGNAEGLVANLKKKGLGARAVLSDNDGFWRVQAGPYPTLFEAQKAGRTFTGDFPSNFVIAQ